ncbi:hypothetical protein FNH05_17305, partial [Amycolatopsis rhizosphaerae]
MRRRTFLGGSVVTGTALAWGTAGSANASAAPGPEAGVHERVVRDARMEWHGLPTGWQDAPFLGNGSLTAQVHFGGRAGALSFAFGAAGEPLETPSGRLDLVLAGTPTTAVWEVDPWTAELTGTVTTTRGTVALSVLVPRGHDVLLARLHTTGGEEAAAFTTETGLPKGPWRERRSGTARLLVASPRAGDVAAVRDADYAEMVGRHLRWWQEFYTRSLVSVPDKTAQRFYWIQLYKAAALTRAPHALLTGSNHLDPGRDAVSAPGSRGPAVAIPGTGSKG